MGKNWKESRARDRIRARLREVESVDIRDYTRKTDLEGIPTNRAYKVHGVHAYVDLVNMTDLLNHSDKEGETCHQRLLRFLNLQYRAFTRILERTDTMKVDIHNQRLHFISERPYGADNEAARIHHAVAVAQMTIDVLSQTEDTDANLPSAVARVGIDSGLTLAVNNGRRGSRGTLFLGDAANLSAKLASSGRTEPGIYLTNNARAAIGLDELDEADVELTPLTPEEIKVSQNEADLAVTVDEIVDEWWEHNKKKRLRSVTFSKPALPLSTLKIDELTSDNSRRRDAVSTYADIDGFTRYVREHIEDDPEDVVRSLHVLRSEIDAVMSSDFGGRRIRFIGDCVHALSAEGTTQTTDPEETVSAATLCAGGIRSSFELALEMLSDEGIDTEGLGIAIGFDYGPMTITRLGIRGRRIRCSVSRGVLRSEEQQKRCDGAQTAIGRAAYNVASRAVKNLFGTDRIVTDLDYDAAIDAMSADGDKTAKAAAVTAFSVVSPASAKSVERPVRNFCEGRHGRRSR